MLSNKFVNDVNELVMVNNSYFLIQKNIQWLVLLCIASVVSSRVHVHDVLQFHIVYLAPDAAPFVPGMSSALTHLLQESPWQAPLALLSTQAAYLWLAPLPFAWNAPPSL